MQTEVPTRHMTHDRLTHNRSKALTEVAAGTPVAVPRPPSRVPGRTLASHPTGGRRRRLLSTGPPFLHLRWLRGQGRGGDGGRGWAGVSEGEP